jgi:two-component sensor histidine kinase
MLRALKNSKSKSARLRILLMTLLVVAWTSAAVLIVTQRLYPGDFQELYQRFPPFFFGWLVLSPFVVGLAFRFPLERPKLCLSVPVHIVGCILAIAGAQYLGHGSLEILVPFGRGGDAPRMPPGGFGEHKPPPGEFEHRGPPPDEFERPGPPPDGFQHSKNRPDGTRESPGFRKAPRRALGPGAPSRFNAGVMFDALFYVSIVSLCHSVRFLRHAQQRERRSLELESRLAKTNLDMLRMQLNPHFLFNTLNAISTLVHTNPHAADNMITDLSGLLRDSLESLSEPEVPLRRELEYLRHYTDIEQTRFGKRLRIEQEIDPAVLDAMVPTFILQPLVENAIRHGLEPQLGAGCVKVQALREGETLQLRVSDNGKGLESLKKEGNTERHGIGLNNTRARLEELYGSGQRFILLNLPEGGCAVTLQIPESAGNYVAVHSGKESQILRETLNALEKQLDPDKFMRVSRSALVNIDFIKELQPMFRGQHLVVLRNGKQIPMTRGLREVEKALRFS